MASHVLCHVLTLLHNPAEDGETLNKASSCPPLNEGLLPAEGAPLTPRLLSLPPAAAVPAASKSPTPPRTSPIPESASSGTAPACAAAAAAVADTAATPAFGATSSPAVSAAVAPLHGLMAPPPGLAPISAPMAVPAVVASLLPAPAYTSSPVTPNVATPPPETPRTKARAGAGRGRSNGRAGSAEPRAGGYKGRFCGRLFLKVRRYAERCAPVSVAIAAGPQHEARSCCMPLHATARCLKSLPRSAVSPPKFSQPRGSFRSPETLQEDEAKLALECQLTGHLLGCGSGNGDDSARHTLAKIVRDIASGAVREHCEKRERCMQVGNSIFFWSTLLRQRASASLMAGAGRALMSWLACSSITCSPPEGLANLFCASYSKLGQACHLGLCSTCTPAEAAVAVSAAGQVRRLSSRSCRHKTQPRGL